MLVIIYFDGAKVLAYLRKSVTKLWELVTTFTHLKVQLLNYSLYIESADV